MILTIVATYIGLFSGLFLGRICSEELISGKIYIKVLKKVLLSFGVLLFSYVFLSPLFEQFAGLFSVILSFAFYKIRFSNQIVVFFWPLALVALRDSFWFIFVTGLFFLYLLVIGSEIVSSVVNKNDVYKITISIKDLIKKGIKETNLVLVSYVFCLLIILLM